MYEQERQMWGFVDNYDANGVPAGIVPVGSIPDVDKRRLDDEGKMRLAKVCAKAKTGYYLDMEKYKNATDPQERARLAAKIEEDEKLAMRYFEEGQKDG